MSSKNRFREPISSISKAREWVKEAKEDNQLATKLSALWTKHKQSVRPTWEYDGCDVRIRSASGGIRCLHTAPIALIFALRNNADVIRSVEMLEALAQEHEDMSLTFFEWDDFYESTLANAVLDDSVESEIGKHRREYLEFLFDETQKEEKHTSCKSLALKLFLNGQDAAPWNEHDEIVEGRCDFPTTRRVTIIYVDSQCGNFSTWLGVTDLDSLQKKIEHFMKRQIIMRTWGVSAKEALYVVEKYDTKWPLPEFLQKKAQRIASDALGISE